MMSLYRRILPLGLFCLLLPLPRLAAQNHAIDFNPSGINYARGRSWWSTLFGQSPIPVRPLDLRNTHRIYTLIHKGQIYLSLREAIALALENNLDIAIQRFNLPMADADILQARAGLAPSGVSTGVISGTLGGQGATTGASGATGSGTGGTSTAAGGAGTGAGGLVTSAIGGGPAIPNLDPTFTTNFNVSSATTPETITFITGTSQLISHTTTTNFSLSKGWLTGTNLSVGFDNNRNSSNNARTLFNPYLNSGLSVTVTQPLLQGFGTAVNGRDILIAKNNREISDIAFRQQVEATVNQIEDIYWNLVSAYNALQYAQGSIKLSRQILADNRRQVQIGTLAPISITQAEAQVATGQQQLIVAQTNYEYQQLLMKNAITKNMNNPLLVAAGVVPTNKIQVPAQIHIRPVQDLIKEALQYRPELAIARLNMTNERISIRGIRNQLLPQLNLFGTYSAAGLAGTLVPQSSSNPFGGGASVNTGLFVGGIGTDFNNVFAGNFPTYTAGITLQIPIYNRAVQAQAVRAQLELQQSQTQEQQQANTIALQVRNAQYSLLQNHAQVMAAQEAVRLDQQTLDAERKKFDLGASTLLNVITDQTTLTQAQSNLIAAETAFQESSLNLEVLTGRILSDNRISILDAENGHVKALPQPTP